MTLGDFLMAHPKVVTYPKVNKGEWKIKFVYVFSRASALRELEDYQVVGAKGKFTMLKRKLEFVSYLHEFNQT